MHQHQVQTQTTPDYEITKHIYSYKQHTSLLSSILLSGLAIQFDRCALLSYFLT